MAKTIAVVGATGSQGGSIARTMLKEGWNVRAITRNPSGDAAKAIQSEGATIVQANSDDEESLIKAFEGAHAIFAVTNFWEILFAGGKTADEAGKAEATQALNLARAAAKTPTLEHYLWSTLPSAENTTKGRIRVPHLDFKAAIDDRMRSEMPELAKKTTYLWFGTYGAQNMAFFPNLKPFELPVTPGVYVQIMPSKPDANIPVVGDMAIVPGMFAKAILAHPEKTLGRYCFVASETLTWRKMLEIWGEVMGRKTAYVETTVEGATALFGPVGEELALQMKWGEEVAGWGSVVPSGKLLTREELGLGEEHGFRASVEKLKAFWQ